MHRARPVRAAAPCFSRRRAQGLVEYGLILAFVSLVAILSLIWMAPAISSLISPANLSL